MTVSAAEICAMIEAEVTKMSVNFDHYKIFYYVAKYQNITFDEDLLFLSQPTVSRCIQNLEAETGCRLFDRSKKGVALTPDCLLYTSVIKLCQKPRKLLDILFAHLFHHAHHHLHRMVHHTFKHAFPLRCQL